MKVQWTSEWQLRCTSCNEVRLLANTGGYRVVARDVHKSTVAWCRACCRPRLMVVEPAPRKQAAEAKG